MADIRSSPCAAVAVSVLAVSMTSYASEASAAPPGSASEGDFSGLVGVAGWHWLYLECRGNGSPTVGLQSGFGNGAGIWSLAEADPPAVQPGWRRSHGCAATTVRVRSSPPAPSRCRVAATRCRCPAIPPTSSPNCMTCWPPRRCPDPTCSSVTLWVGHSTALRPHLPRSGQRDGDSGLADATVADAGDPAAVGRIRESAVARRHLSRLCGRGV